MRQGFLSGTIDDNPLSNSATTLNSTELAGLEAIDSTEHAVLVLDPTGAGNGPEVVYVTAHTGSATSATVVRGREGTSGVQHSSVMTWVHVPTIHDYIQTLTSSSRPSTGGIPYQGQPIYETDTNRDVRYNGSAWTRGPWYASGGRTGWQLRRNATQSVNHNTVTAISFDAEDTDTDSFIAVTASAITIPSGLGGLYIVNYTVANAGNTASVQRSWLSINDSTTQVASPPTQALGGGAQSDFGNSGGNVIHQSGMATLALAAGDVVRLMVIQTTGGAVAYTALCNGWRIGA